MKNVLRKGRRKECQERKLDCMKVNKKIIGLIQEVNESMKIVDRAK